MNEVLAIDSLSTDEVLDRQYAQLRQLKNLVKARRRRELAQELVTDMFLGLTALAKRVADKGAFTEGPVAMEEEDEAQTEDRRVPMGDLFSGEDTDMTEADEVEDLEALRQMIRDLQKSRLQYFQIFLAYLCKGCRQEVEVSKRVLAMVRRAAPHLLEQFGLSQAAVARKLGQQRATVSIREKKMVEGPLKASGAKGISSNGSRGDATSAACAKAARGNTNRRARRLAHT